MRNLFDAVTPANIPADAQMVAGYLNGRYAWTQADWARFPNAVKVGISVRADYTFGHVLDVENGDATPEEAVTWVQARRTSGADPSVYCGAFAWSTVRAAFQTAGVAEPHYWIAHYDGDPTIPTGAVAKQHTTTAGYDASSVADFWPGVDTQEADMPLTQADAATIFWGTPFDNTDNFAQYLKSHVANIEAGQAGLLAAVTAATKDPAITLDALKQIVNDAVAAHVQITGTVQVGPA